MAGIGHQHAIAAGEAEIGGERRALVAALLLDHLHQQHLAALDDVLDLVAAAQRLALGANVVDLLGPGTLAAAIGSAAALPAASAAARGAPGGGCLLRCIVAGFIVLAVLGASLAIDGVGVSVEIGIGIEQAVLDRGDLILLGGVDLLDAGVVLGVAGAGPAGGILLVLLRLAQRGFFLRVRQLLGDQRLPVGGRDLVIIGMNLAEGEEAVPVARRNRRTPPATKVLRG